VRGIALQPSACPFGPFADLKESIIPVIRLTGRTPKNWVYLWQDEAARKG